MALAAGQQKSPERRIARARWRNFGDYALLEDSRYASQLKMCGGAELSGSGAAERGSGKPELRCNPSCSKKVLTKRKALSGWRHPLFHYLDCLHGRAERLDGSGGIGLHHFES